VEKSLKQELQESLDLVDTMTGLTAEQRETRKSNIREYFADRQKRMLERFEAIQRDKKVELTLGDALRRALENSFVICGQAYSPAIDAARVVEAEAQFDAIFYASFTNNNQERPSPSELMGTHDRTRLFESGVRKMLPTGAQMQTSYQFNRHQSNLIFQTLNPSYFNSFNVELAQPLLRNFGLDFNRSQIMMNKLDRKISVEELRRQIRETVFNVEQAYWNVYVSRRLVTITARLLTNLETILRSLEKRKEAEYDVYAVQLEMTRSRIEQTRAEFVRLKNEVRNAEDNLKAAINDPVLNLSEDVEIVPASIPVLEPIMVDKFGEAAAALENRAELREARLAIEKSEIGVGVAKNQALPRLDLVFRYIVNGLGSNLDRAFSELSRSDFHEYFVSLEFEWPIGNRGPEARLRQARLQQAQAIYQYRAQIENVIRETLQSVRELQTNYEQIDPSLQSAQASEAQLQATVERMIKRSPANLQVELDAHQALAGARQQLLQVVVDYNLALTNLERSKGTLLDYYNIEVYEGRDDLPPVPVGAQQVDTSR